MKSWPYFSAACRKDVDRVLLEGRLTAYRANADWGVSPQKWSQAYALEREIEGKFKVKHAVAVNSGTAALHASLEALDVRGKSVITSPFTFSATASSILLAGGEPVFVDVDPQTFTITKETVKHAITKKTVAILPVHLFGYFQDLEALQSFGLPIIEDACQSVGARRGIHFSGTRGLAGAYSFNGSKNVPAGEGGCLVTNDDKIAERARLLVNHGENFGTKEVGLNYRMHELVAVLARHGLRELDARNERRRDLAGVIFDSEMFEDGKNINLPQWCQIKECCRDWHSFYVYPFTLCKANRSRFISRCAKRGLPIQESYTTPLHHLKAFRKYCSRPLPVVDELHSKTLCLLTTLTPDKPLSYARKVAKIIREALE